jgi:hypothetical protein
MAQIFPKSSNTVARASIVCGVATVCLLGWGLNTVYWSPFTTNVNVPLEQPVPFSHKHHVGDDGIDCRYCHTGVETSAFADIPPTETCMTCHSRLFTDAPLLAPVRESLARGMPLKWVRVHDLPDFVYFDHSIHVNKGIGCSTCHGRVDEMPLTWKVNTLYMKWCLDCHREPERFIRPRSEIFNMAWTPPRDQIGHGRKLIAEYHVNTAQMTDCRTCHR